MLPLLSICNNISINSHHLKDPNTGNLQMTVLYIHDLILPELFHLLHCTGLDVDKNQFEYVHFVIHLLIYTLDVTVLWIQYTWTKTTFCVQFKSRIYHVDKFNHFLYVNMYTTFKMFPIDNRMPMICTYIKRPTLLINKQSPTYYSTMKKPKLYYLGLDLIHLKRVTSDLGALVLQRILTIVLVNQSWESNHGGRGGGMNDY